MLAPDTIEIRIGLSPEEKKILEKVAAAARIPLRNWIRERIFRLAALEMMGVSAVLPYARLGQNGVIQLASTGHLVETPERRAQLEAKDTRRRRKHEEAEAVTAVRLERFLDKMIRRRCDTAAKDVVAPLVKDAKREIIKQLDHIARKHLFHVLNEAGRNKQSKAALPDWLEKWLDGREPTSEDIEEIVGQRVWGSRWPRVKYLRGLRSQVGKIGADNRWHK